MKHIFPANFFHIFATVFHFFAAPPSLLPHGLASKMPFDSDENFN
jgi:hypothetical protein